MVKSCKTGKKDARRSSPAERMRRHRARQRAGKRVFRIEADQALLEIALQTHDHLSSVTDDPKEIERALGRMIAQFCRVVTRNGAGE
jgi:transcription termination factor NusB